jgi:hypothetical protein
MCVYTGGFESPGHMPEPSGGSMQTAISWSPSPPKMPPGISGMVMPSVAIRITRTSTPLSMICWENAFRFCCTNAISSSMLPDVSMPMMMSAGCSVFCAVCETAPHSPPSGAGSGAIVPELGGGVTGMPMSPRPAAPEPVLDAPLAPAFPPAPG